VAKLIINPTSGAKKEIPLSGRVISIGRDPSNDLVLSDSMVSRRHAILELRGEEYVLRDNNSSNGTLINGDKISSEHPVHDGDLISIGSCRLLFQSDSASVGASASPPTAMSAAPAASAPAPAAAGAGADIVCGACGLPATAADRFCRQCGKELAVEQRRLVCPSCGTPVKPPANFCGSCGKPIPRAGEPRLPPTQPLVRDPLLEEGTSPRPGPAPASGRGAVEPVPAGFKQREEGRRSPEAFSASPVPGRGGNGGAQAAASSSPAEAPRAAAAPRPAAPRPAARPPVRPGVEAAGASGAAAGFWIRLAAYLIDGVILSIPAMAVVGVILLLVFRGGGAEIDPESFSSGLFLLAMAGNVLSFALAFAYFLYFWGARGATPGKRLLGLKVVTGNGESPIGYGRAALRILGYFLNGFTFGIGFLLIALNEEKRGLHDRIADTRVIKDR
jgi:uncharacterized RDD family membrane protein YckC